MVEGKVEPKKRQEVGLAAICGPLAIVVMIVCISIPLITSPWFSWTDNALSDLGIYSEYKLIFSYGLILSGVLLMFFSIGLLDFLGKRTKIAAYGFIVGSTGLIGVGIFPDGLLHILSVLLLFISLAVGLFILGMKSKDEGISKISLYTLSAGISSLILLNWFAGYAITETVVFFACAILFIYFSNRMLTAVGVSHMGIKK